MDLRLRSEAAYEAVRSLWCQRPQNIKGLALIVDWKSERNQAVPAPLLTLYSCQDWHIPQRKMKPQKEKIASCAWSLTKIVFAAPRGVDFVSLDFALGNPRSSLGAAYGALVNSTGRSVGGCGTSDPKSEAIVGFTSNAQ